MHSSKPLPNNVKKGKGSGREGWRGRKKGIEEEVWKAKAREVVRRRVT